MKNRAIVWAAVSTKPQANEDEHFSIPKQISDGEQFCAENGFQVVDVLRVPGHSRSYRTLDNLAADARKKGIEAFDRLIEHLERADFDVFICRDANRFARKASLLHYIVETIIEDCGAKIWSQNDHLWIDEDNMDMWATFKGYTVRSEVKWLVQATEDGLKKRAERGLTTTKVPFSHRLIRNESLKPVALEVDEGKRRLFTDLAYLLIEEKLGFNGIERVLYERFGHVAKDGKPYGDNVMYTFVYSPLTWGITTYGHGGKKRKLRYFGTWIFNEDEDPPEDITAYRNTVTPVYTGDLAEALKGELLRRKEMVGRRRPNTASEFSGLFVCGHCNYTMVVKTNDYGAPTRTPYAIACNFRYGNFQHRPICVHPEHVSMKYVREYLVALLDRLLETRDLSMLTPDQHEAVSDIARAESDLIELQRRLDNLIDLQAAAHSATQASYQRRIDDLGQQIETLQRRVQQLGHQEKRRQREWATGRAALSTIEQYRDKFWSLPPAEINQMLFRLMGDRRFVVRDGVIIGTQLKPSQQPRKRANSNNA